MKKGRKRWRYAVLEIMREEMPGRVMLFFAFAIPFLVMLAMFVARGIYPFGDRSFLFSDMYHQYMPFFSEFMRKIKEGEGLAYSYNVGIGSNFLALYVYYLASPLHWLAFLFPQEYLMEFMSYLVVIKIGLCGLTSCIYLRQRFQTKDAAVLFFSTLYALSGYLAAYNWNIMWLDCVVLFPLIVLGLERLVKENRWGLYCITLGLSILTNFYISIMICIYLVLYFAVLLVGEKRSFRIVRNFVFASLLAGGLAAVLLVPEVCAILETDFGNMEFPEELTSYFPVLDVLARHCLAVTTERGLEHWPNIYCGAAVFLLLPMYALNQRISIRKRFANLALAGFLLLSFSTNMLDFVWHGMNYPDSLPARQSFLYILLVLTMCYEAYHRVNEISKNQILYGYLSAVAFLLFCEKFIESEHFTIGIEMGTLVFVTVYAILLYLHRTRVCECAQGTVSAWKLGIALTALIAVVAETSINTYCTSVGTVSRSAYLGQQEDYRSLYEEAKAQDTSFFRVEKFTRKTKNDGTLTGYPTASVFSSTMNSYVMDLYERWGMRHSKVYYGYDGATAFTSALLNVKYMFGETENEANSLYTLKNQRGDIYFYEADKTLPFGYVAPTGYDLPEGYDREGLKLQNAMVKDLGIEGTLFDKVKCEQKEDNVRLEVEEDGYYYMMVNAYGTSKVVANGSFGERKFNDLKKGSVLYLGYLQKGANVVLKNDDEEDESQKITLTAYRMNEGVLDEALELLSAQHMENVVYDSTSLQGEITLQEAGRLILSIPHEKGWKVTIDGAETEPALFGGTFMAFDLEPGYHTLSMHYVPEGKYLGMAVSAVSLILLGVWLAVSGRDSQRKEK